MPQNITTSAKSLVEAAEREIETLPVEEAIKLHGRDDVVLVDIRDIRELQREGKVPGAFHCPRGMLEFWIDPASPYHKPKFAEDKRFVFFCAGGLRSALATQTAQRMGLEAGGAHPRRLRRVEDGRRAGRGAAAQTLTRHVLICRAVSRPCVKPVEAMSDQEAPKSSPLWSSSGALSMGILSVVGLLGFAVAYGLILERTRRRGGDSAAPEVVRVMSDPVPGPAGPKGETGPRGERGQAGPRGDPGVRMVRQGLRGRRLHDRMRRRRDAADGALRHRPASCRLSDRAQRAVPLPRHHQGRDRRGLR